MGAGVDKDLGRGWSRKQARRNKVMRRVLYDAFDLLLDQCLREGWYGEIDLHARVENGILQRNYTTRSLQHIRLT